VGINNRKVEIFTPTIARGFKNSLFKTTDWDEGHIYVNWIEISFTFIPIVHGHGVPEQRASPRSLSRTRSRLLGFSGAEKERKDFSRANYQIAFWGIEVSDALHL
jgi:hypothetical protein